MKCLLKTYLQLELGIVLLRPGSELFKFFGMNERILISSETEELKNCLPECCPM